MNNKKTLENRKTKFILIGILVLSFLLRVYKFKSFYVFGHDQDLASWIIKDILVNGHLRLIGQETSSQGVLIGALYYYLQIPFYLLTNMNPLGSVFLSVILGVFATFSVFYVISRMANKNAGLIASFIYAVSTLIVFTDREVAPTMPVMLWTIWYLYGLYLVYKNKYLNGFLLCCFLLGLVWHLNMALIILAPLVVVAFLFSERKFNLKAFLLGVAVFLITSSPFLVFELRHNFSQTNAIYLSLTTEKDLEPGTSKGYKKLDRVMQLVNKNAIGIFSKANFVRPSLVVIALVALFAYLVLNKKINNFLALTFVLWQSLYITFFTLNSINASEYYFNGMNIVWIFIASLGLSELAKNRNGKFIFYLLAFMFLATNVSSLLKFNTDRKGYIEKMALVKQIKDDSLKHGYPCVSVSYITSPGYDLGYRYLFWLNDMHVNKPISGSPVYTIVYPHRLVDKIDDGFGSLGLIYPDYDRYNKEDVSKSCEGENANLTEPMFGYTQ